MTFLAFNGVPVPDLDVDSAEAFMLCIAIGTRTEVTQMEIALSNPYGR